MVSKELPRIIITMGDPAGIGPEIVAKSLASSSVSRVCRPIIVGDRRFLPRRLPPRVAFEDVPVGNARAVKAGCTSAECGRAVYAWVLKAVEMLRQGEADALVTAPISKAALRMAGVRFPGHTEMLAGLTCTGNFGMLMAAGRLRAAMVTRHIPLSDAGKKITRKDIASVALLSEQFLRARYGISSPRIAVCALNPHAGEGGLLGKEEQRTIAPAVRRLKGRGMAVDGPLPGDSAWKKMADGDYDLLVAMYHDQAMIGLKCLAPEKIVNITMGLPFIRTSPGHGTAFDIAGKNRADPRSMIESILVAAKLTGHKTQDTGRGIQD